jgi:DNA-binding MarR family transcriptional regulator
MDITYIRWMRDFITTEIVAWEYIDRVLKTRHGISLAFFEVLDTLADAPQHAMRIGDIARALRITVGAASKLIDRIEATQLVARQPDKQDRRASSVVLSQTGITAATVARATYVQRGATHPRRNVYAGRATAIPHAHPTNVQRIHCR